MRTAQCVCGALKVHCGGEPSRVSLCHCLQCQRRTGSLYGVAAFYPHDAVSIEGHGQVFTRASDGGSRVSFRFCPSCGSTVYWQVTSKPDVIVVAVGCFGDPDFPKPGKAAYVEHQHGWAAPTLADR